MISTQFKKRQNCQTDPGGPRAPNRKLSNPHLEIKPGCINPIVLINRIPSRELTRLKPDHDSIAPFHESHCDKQSSDERHYAQRHRADYIEECGQEGAIRAFADKTRHPVDLNRRRYKQNYTHEDCVVAEGLRSPIDYILAVRFLPCSS